MAKKSTMSGTLNYQYPIAIGYGVRLPIYLIYEFLRDFHQNAFMCKPTAIKPCSDEMTSFIDLPCLHYISTGYNLKTPFGNDKMFDVEKERLLIEFCH